MSYFRAIGILNAAENVAYEFFRRIKEMDTAIEAKYQLKELCLLASWQSKEDLINRNIVLQVSEDGNSISFEANAWIDDHANLKRNWCHIECGKISVNYSQSIAVFIAIGNMLEKVFQAINKVESGDLSRVSYLKPSPQ